MEFVKEKTVKTKVFDTSVFDIGHAYLCTFRHPVLGITFTAKCILRWADDECLTFITSNPYTEEVIKISIDDAPCWTIEKMIEPMSEQELDFLKHLLITFRTTSEKNDIIDRIMKKLGFNTKES